MAENFDKTQEEDDIEMTARQSQRSPYQRYRSDRKCQSFRLNGAFKRRVFSRAIKNKNSNNQSPVSDDKDDQEDEYSKEQKSVSSHH